MSEICSKQQFYLLWEAGVLGNRTRLWRDPLEAQQWGREHDVMIGFREIRTGAGAGKWQRVPWTCVLSTAEEWRREGRRFIMDDGEPDDKRTLQGEVCRTLRGFESYLQIGSRLPMRPAMAAGLMKHRGYLETKVLLDHYMDPSSRDDLDMLLELYPEATVEFSCFSVNVGMIPNRNTIFWECRNY